VVLEGLREPGAQAMILAYNYEGGLIIPLQVFGTGCLNLKLIGSAYIHTTTLLTHPLNDCVSIKTKLRVHP